MADVLEQVRADGRRAADRAPAPTVEQMRRVGQLVRPVREVAA